MNIKLNKKQLIIVEQLCKLKALEIESIHYMHYEGFITDYMHDKFVDTILLSEKKEV